MATIEIDAEQLDCGREAPPPPAAPAAPVATASHALVLHDPEPQRWVPKQRPFDEHEEELDDHEIVCGPEAQRAFARFGLKVVWNELQGSGTLLLENVNEPIVSRSDPLADGVLQLDIGSE